MGKEKREREDDMYVAFSFVCLVEGEGPSPRKETEGGANLGE